MGVEVFTIATGETPRRNKFSFSRYLPQEFSLRVRSTYRAFFGQLEVTHLVKFFMK
jgi:hypothetical protein